MYGNMYNNSLLQVGLDHTSNAAGIKHAKCTAECPHFCSQKWSFANAEETEEIDTKMKVSCGMYFSLYTSTMNIADQSRGTQNNDD